MKKTRGRQGVALWYGIYRASDDTLLACGSCKECCAMMGYKDQHSLHHLVWAVRSGRCKAFEIYTEPLREEAIHA